MNDDFIADVKATLEKYVDCEVCFLCMICNDVKGALCLESRDTFKRALLEVYKED